MLILILHVWKTWLVKATELLNTESPYLNMQKHVSVHKTKCIMSHSVIQMLAATAYILHHLQRTSRKHLLNILNSRHMPPAVKAWHQYANSVLWYLWNVSFIISLRFELSHTPMIWALLYIWIYLYLCIFSDLSIYTASWMKWCQVEWLCPLFSSFLFLSDLSSPDFPYFIITSSYPFDFLVFH